MPGNAGAELRNRWSVVSSVRVSNRFVRDFKSLMGRMGLGVVVDVSDVALVACVLKASLLWVSSSMTLFNDRHLDTPKVKFIL